MQFPEKIYNEKREEGQDWNLGNTVIKWYVEEGGLGKEIFRKRGKGEGYQRSGESLRKGGGWTTVSKALEKWSPREWKSGMRMDLAVKKSL